MPKLLMIDTQVYIWGIEGHGINAPDGAVKKSKALIDSIQKNKSVLIMPTPQLVEVASFAPPNEQAVIIQKLKDRFQIVPFDDIAATVCAELIYENLNDQEIQFMRQEGKVTKAKVKFDCLIVAIGIVRRVSAIYSDDPDLKKFARGRIDILRVPDISTQSDLFGNQIAL